MLDLEALSHEFKKWRGNRNRCHYPIHLWDKARKIAEHKPIHIVAEAIGVSAIYLKRKLKANSTSTTFIPVKINSFPGTVSIQFTDHHCRTMTTQFQANHEQLIHIIQSLSSNTL